MRRYFILIAVVLGILLISQPAVAGNHTIGIGGHYWTVIDDIDVDNIEEDGFAMVLSYQYKPTLIGFELDVEIAEEQLTGQTGTIYSPQAFVIVGSTIYGALGIGTHYYADSNDDDFSDPFYVARVGLDFELLPNIHLDINANYRFDDLKEYKDIKDDADTNTVTLGVMGRIEF